MNNAHPATMATLRQAIEGRDDATLLSLYAPDADFRVVDRLHPPSLPLAFHGRGEIGPYLADICGRAMSHTIQNAVVDGDHWAFTEDCRYPDGTRVLCMASITVQNGLIVRQVNLQAWDETS